MRVQILAIGKMRQGPELELTTEYIQRFNRQGSQVGIGPVTVQEIPFNRNRPVEDLINRIGDVSGNEKICILDIDGKPFSSEEMARMLSRCRDECCKEITFVIGGPDGFGANMIPQEYERLSLGRIVFPHLLARVIIAEQLYRAVSILAGSPYHRS